VGQAGRGWIRRSKRRVKGLPTRPRVRRGPSQSWGAAKPTVRPVPPINGLQAGRRAHWLSDGQDSPGPCFESTPSSPAH